MVRSSMAPRRYLSISFCQSRKFSCLGRSWPVYTFSALRLAAAILILSFSISLAQGPPALVSSFMQ